MQLLIPMSFTLSGTLFDLQMLDSTEFRAWISNYIPVPVLYVGAITQPCHNGCLSSVHHWMLSIRYPLKQPVMTKVWPWRPLRHDGVIKWKHFPRYWPFVRGIHRSPVDSPHIGQWRGAFMFSLICVWTNSSVNNRNARDLRRHRAHNVTVMLISEQIMGMKIRCVIEIILATRCLWCWKPETLPSKHITQ